MLKIIKTKKLKNKAAMKLLIIISDTKCVRIVSDENNSKHFTQNKTTIKQIVNMVNGFIVSKYFFIINYLLALISILTLSNIILSCDVFLK